MHAILVMLIVLGLCTPAHSADYKGKKTLEQGDIWVYKEQIVKPNEEITSNYAQYELMSNDADRTWSVVYIPITDTQFRPGVIVPKKDQKIRAIFEGPQMSKATCIPDVTSGTHLLIQEKCQQISIGQKWTTVGFRNVQLLHAKYRVTKKESIEVGAETFQAFRIEATGTYYVKEIMVKNGEWFGYKSLENTDCIFSTKARNRKACVVSRKTKSTYWFVPEINSVVKSVTEIQAKYGPEMTAINELQTYTNQRAMDEKMNDDRVE